ncbi:MAG: right-handed parallel beta-helix repeat-containing protein, partial [Alphaproteobacteria bacterium]|nr:right-handed parallel beta-helix repeat-containing protein [Alphaproteobacteria bacterium]
CDNAGTGDPYAFENAAELLDTPGEWFWDRRIGTLTYLLRPGEKVTSVEIPMVQTLVRLQGNKANPVHHISFRGITFEQSNWSAPSRDGLIIIQATYLNTVDGSRFMPGAVEVRGEGSHDLAFERNVFRQAGATGLAVFKGARDIEIVGNTVHDVAGSGITVDTDPERYEQSAPGSIRMTITDNIVHDIGIDYTGAIGIFGGYIGESVIARNHIYNTPYTAISVGWGWTYLDNPSRNNRIERNHIHDVMRVHDDGAAIYLLSKQPGTIVSSNYIHDIPRAPFAGAFPVAAIYLDNGAEQITVENNLLERVEIKYNQNFWNEPEKGVFPAKGNIIREDVADRAAVIAGAGPASRP